MFAVKHSPFDMVPQVRKRGEDGRKRPAAVMVKQSGNIFKQQIPRLPGFSQSGKFKEQGPSGIAESFSRPSDAERLTRESTAEQIEFREFSGVNCSCVLTIPFLLTVKQRAVASQCVFIALAEAYTRKSAGKLQALTEPADAGEHIDESDTLLLQLPSLFKMYLLQAAWQSPPLPVGYYASSLGPLSGSSSTASASSSGSTLSGWSSSRGSSWLPSSSPARAASKSSSASSRACSIRPMMN